MSCENVDGPLYFQPVHANVFGVYLDITHGSKTTIFRQATLVNAFKLEVNVGDEILVTCGFTTQPFLSLAEYRSECSRLRRDYHRIKESGASDDVVSRYKNSYVAFEERGWLNYEEWDKNRTFVTYIVKIEAAQPLSDNEFKFFTSNSSYVVTTSDEIAKFIDQYIHGDRCLPAYLLASRLFENFERMRLIWTCVREKYDKYHCKVNGYIVSLGSLPYFEFDSLYMMAY
jgi:hypothetical protein